MVTFRLATIADGAELAKMRWAFRAEDGERPVQSEAEFTDRYLAFLREGLSSNRWTYWVAEDAGELVAHMALHVVRSVPRPSRRRDQWGYLTDCYTRPDYRNQEIGSRLIERVSAWAMSLDLEMLLVSPSERSRPFYARAEFRTADGFLTRALREYDAPEPADA